MKKYLIIILSLIFIVGLIIVGTKIKYQDKNQNNNQEKELDKNSIEYTGWLKTDGCELKNQHGEPIQLRGLSSHGIQWYPDVITYDNLKELKENWNVNVFRIAMYTDPDVNGYIAHPEQSKKLVKQIVEYAKSLDLYVIIDWHILKDNNPQTYQDDAIKFFDEMSKEYKDTPNVIYEICNEPNGYDVKWNSSIKPYAEAVIKTIRKNSPKSLVIVGTPNWCTDIKSVVENPIKTFNIIYACHFYAGSHKSELREEIDYARNNNIPIIISECGITNSTGNGAIYEESFNEWIEYINDKNLSWIFWSFSYKKESSSILKSEYKPVEVKDDNAEFDNNEENEEKSANINEYLTKTGEIIKSLLKK